MSCHVIEEVVMLSIELKVGRVRLSLKKSFCFGGGRTEGGNMSPCFLPFLR